MTSPSSSISLALSIAGAATSAAPSRTVFEVRARPAPIIRSGSDEPRARRNTGTATAMLAAIACIGFSMARCFIVAIQLWVWWLILSDTSALMCRGEILSRMPSAVTDIPSLNGSTVPASSAGRCSDSRLNSCMDRVMTSPSWISFKTNSRCVQWFLGRPKASLYGRSGVRKNAKRWTRKRSPGSALAISISLENKGFNRRRQLRTDR